MKCGEAMEGSEGMEQKGCIEENFNSSDLIGKSYRVFYLDMILRMLTRKDWRLPLKIDLLSKKRWNV